MRPNVQLLNGMAQNILLRRAALTPQRMLVLILDRLLPQYPNWVLAGQQDLVLGRTLV